MTGIQIPADFQIIFNVLQSQLSIKMLVDSLRNRDLALFFVLINLPAIKRIFLWSRHEENNVTVPSAASLSGLELLTAD